MTPLDALHAAMVADPDNETPRRAYFARLLASDLVLALDGPAADTAAPRLLEVEGHRVALAFDSEARFAEIGGAPDYLAMTGRELAAILAGAGLGLGLNLASDGAALHLAPDDVNWLAQQGGDAREEAAKITSVGPPVSAPQDLLSTLDARLATLTGLAEAAFLVTIEREDGASSLVLICAGTPPPLRAQVAGNIAEALRVGGFELGLDVAFADPGDPLLPPAHRHGLRFDVPRPEAAAPSAPGSNPDKPPRLH